MKKNFKSRQFLLVSLSLFLLLSLTGCWSSHEIEELRLEVGIALDKGKESATEKELEEQGGGYPKRNIITLTHQFINAQATGAGNKGTGTQQKTYLNISDTGDSIHQIIRELPLNGKGNFTSQHTKVIVIGEKLLRTYSLDRLLNEFLRDNEIRPSCLVIISKGRASKALELNNPGEVSAFSLVKTTESQSRTTRILPPMPLAKLTGKMQSESSFLLQNVVSANGEVKFAGAAVINGKTKKLVGFLNEEELEGITWITGKGKGGLVKSFDQETKELIIYEIESMNSQIIPHVKGENISFDVNIESEGRLSENWVAKGNPFDNKFLNRTKKAAEKEVKHLVQNVTNKMQKEYQTDLAGFGNQLRIEHPKLWEKIKKDWDERFSNVPIKYNVKLTIKDYGTFGASK
ncbi:MULTISPECIES: Ger(x)C family spore germination protein [Bacillaceae]|uniref:Ger(x)C family spore germination protein n=1 Tax=Bacillaceae TaxID=186817 RepID=UPI002FFE4CA6